MLEFAAKPSGDGHRRTKREPSPANDAEHSIVSHARSLRLPLLDRCRPFVRLRPGTWPLWSLS